jgi:hypothetical protein
VGSAELEIERGNRKIEIRADIFMPAEFDTLAIILKK